MKKYLCAAIVIAALAGCATKGTKFDMAQVDAFQPGVTTIEDAKAALGKPFRILEDESGNRTISWVWVQSTMGNLSGKGARIVFDKNGKMVRVEKRQEID